MFDPIPKVPFGGGERTMSAFSAARAWAYAVAPPPHVGDRVPAELRQLIENECDAELQPRMAEVAQAFGVAPSTL